MAGIELTANWPQHTTLRGIEDVIFQKWNERSAIGRTIFNVDESSQYREHSLTVGGVNLMQQVSEGESLTYLSNNEGFLETYTHLDYANGFRISRRMYRDEMYNTMDKLAIELSLSADATEENILANHLNNAQSSDYLGADGVELCSAAHVREDGTSSLSNELSSAADLSQTSAEQAFIDMSDQRSGGGRRLAIVPKYLVVAPEEGFNADRIFSSRQMSEDNTNAINPIQGKVEVLVWHYLTDADQCTLLADKSQHSLQLYTREEFWTDYETDFDTADIKVKGAFAQSSGWGDWKGTFFIQGV